MTPVFSFTCEECGHEFNSLMRLMRPYEPVECVNCKSRALVKQVTFPSPALQLVKPDEGESQ